MRNLLLSSLLSSMLVACATNPDCLICEAPDDALRAREGRAYLISRLTFPDGTGAATAMGLDLDGRDDGEGDLSPSATCATTSADYTSTLDPRITGVDNAGQELISLAEFDDQTFQGALDAAVMEGRIRWAIEIGEAVDAGTFSTVRVTLHVIDADQAIETLGGVPVADQTLSSRAVASFDLPVVSDLAFGPVAVSGAELDVTGGDVYLLPFDDFALGGIGLDTSVAEDRLVGVLGGTFSVDELVEVTVRTGVGREDDRATIRSVFEVVADIQPRAADPSRCERVSVGFGFEAVPVMLR